eukprot:Nitzschia sp. Nitz4//scaffold97_size77645//49210//51273//NITZ4_005522-RA/size77645-snap-gene-0.106-mRNA-1//1//CDS//3329560668//2057//frame0
MVWSLFLAVVPLVLAFYNVGVSAGLRALETSTYTPFEIVWDDGMQEMSRNLTHVDLLVKAAAENYEPYEPLTMLRKEDSTQASGCIWGQIISFEANSSYYIFQLADSNEFLGSSDYAVIDQYATNANKYEPYEIGTPLRQKFSDGWYFGELSSYDDENMYYEVIWSDGSTETYLDQGYHGLPLIDHCVLSAGVNYKPHSEGTVVRRQFLDSEEWFFGNITSFNSTNLTYLITWSDGDEDCYSDLAEVDTMVLAVTNYVPYANGTLVRHKFGDGIGLLYGTIEMFDVDDRIYIVEWGDGLLRLEYDDLSTIDAMVNDAKSHAPYEVGTEIRVYMANEDVYWWGNVTVFDSDTRMYTVRFYADATEMQYASGLDFHGMVVAARLFEPFASGTLVRKKFGVEWYFGSIHKYDKRSYGYAIVWSDGDSGLFQHEDAVAELVSNAGEGYEAYEEGTIVYGTDWGTLDTFSEEDRSYNILWHNGTLETWNDLAKIDYMVNEGRWQLTMTGSTEAPTQEGAVDEEDDEDDDDDNVKSTEDEYALDGHDEFDNDKSSSESEEDTSNLSTKSTNPRFLFMILIVVLGGIFFCYKYRMLRRRRVSLPPPEEELPPILFVPQDMDGVIRKLPWQPDESSEPYKDSPTKDDEEGETDESDEENYVVGELL